MKIIILSTAILLSSYQMQAQLEKTKFESTIRVETTDSKEQIIEKAAHVIPTPNQLSALQNEFIGFICIGPNTFTRMEWGTGMEDPKLFDLKTLDTDQWCETMATAGMKMIVFTAKHHDGFVLWQSRYTQQGVMSSPFKEGKGDVLKELSASCRKYGLKLSIYLSPADLYQIESPDGLYGNLSQYSQRTIPREVPGRPFENKTQFNFLVDDYNEYFLNQLFELLTEYGPIDEVWFDGAHPKRKGGQKYNYPAWKQLIHTLAPNAVIFGKEDIRWCGNEGGQTRDTEWNVIPYEGDPRETEDFKDLTNADLGSESALLKMPKPYYLHYQPAETNTSIREGWFYRDDLHQKVRSADDVFDIYERAVGGNSIFLLNIPPNREGQLAATDVSVLKETGKRIKETYGKNLLEKAKTSLPLKDQPSEIIVSTPMPITFNRFVIREAIATDGERVEEHALDAFIDGTWKEVARGSNVGYKRILRFPEVTTDKIRVRILKARLLPVISSLSAHYYQTRPPMLIVQRDIDGLVSIEPLPQTFTWNENKQNSAKNLNQGYTIYYTTNGKNPDASSTAYTAPFILENKELKAIAMLKGEQGPVLTETVGLIKKNWQLMVAGSETAKHPAKAAFDENTATYWMTEPGEKNFISIDLGEVKTIKGFAYTPQREHAKGMMEEGLFLISKDGKTWLKTDSFQFGNLINDPVKRYHYFKKELKTRYIRIEATRIAAEGKELSLAELDLF